MFKRLLFILSIFAAPLSQAMFTGKDQVNKKIESVPGEFVVQLSRSQNTNDFAKNLKASGYEIKKIVNNQEGVYLVKSRHSLAKVQKQRIAELKSLNGVEVAEPNFIYRIQSQARSFNELVPSGPMFSQLWGMKNIGQTDEDGRVGKAGADTSATKAWAQQTGSKDVVVAIIDTGIDYTHEALKPNMWVKAKTNANDPDVFGYNAITGVEDPRDDHGHGSHCAGTIGASGTNPDGVVGVNWNVRLMGVKFLDQGGSGTLADAIKAIDWAAAHGAQIMSNSWGGGGFSQLLLDSINRAADKGILFVAAAGNSSSDNDRSPSYPATYATENMVSVAATNNVDELASFSSFGRRTVHIAAPGENILSTVPGTRKYDVYSGTSMATPHVSGAAALLLAHEPSLSFRDVKARLISSADKLTGIRRKTVGGARLNLFNLLNHVEVPVPGEIPENAWSAPVAQSISSEHPYTSSTKQRWELSQAGASYVRLHFAKIQTEAGYDRIKVISAKTGQEVESLSGVMSDGYVTDSIEGDKVIIEFESDNSVNDYGFDINGLSWTTFQN